MHCANCESKIKNNIRFEKGIKKKLKQIWRIKRLLLKYDADKSHGRKKIIAGFAKIHYTATTVTFRKEMRK